jgi:altronate hydrolase
MNKYLKINQLDNVCVAIEDLNEGDVLNVDNKEIVIKNEIPTGHKFSITEIAENENVIKYGYPIGHATQPIRIGDHVHTHNLKTNLKDDLKYAYAPTHLKLDIAHSELKINGYLRSNGEMGIRNELWIVPTVGCVNGQANAIIERVKRELDVSHIDDIRTYTHNYGCSQLGDDHINTQKALARLALHPNAGGVLV